MLAGRARCERLIKKTIGNSSVLNNSDGDYPREYKARRLLSVSLTYTLPEVECLSRLGQKGKQLKVN